MNITTNGVCNDLLSVQLENSVLDLSWALDTDSLRTILMQNGVDKILNFNENIDFQIEIDNVDTFDSINLNQYTFSEIEKTYKGNMVYSAIIDDFNKNQFEETNYFFRVKILNNDDVYNIISNATPTNATIVFEDEWSNICSFTIRKNYTKDLVEAMYLTVADFNAYNKEAKSANMYYIFQAIADTLDKEYEFILEDKNNHFINLIKPDNIMAIFGNLFKFSDPTSITMEEYRRIIRNLIIGYQNGGGWNYIKNVLKYFIGYTPDLLTFKKFYPWILRKQNNVVVDPPIEDRKYTNPSSNYYLYKDGFAYWKNRNEIMLLSDYFENFTFIVRSNNFFNVQVDEEKISNVLDILKSAYTKYNLNIDQYQEVVDVNNAILADSDNYLLANNENVVQY